MRGRLFEHIADSHLLKLLLLAEITPYLINGLPNGKIFILFACINVLSSAFGFWLPEVRSFSPVSSARNVDTDPLPAPSLPFADSRIGASIFLFASCDRLAFLFL